MPIDARIPLAVQAPPAFDPMQAVGQVMTLKNMGQRNHLYEAEIEKDRAETARRQQMLDDEQAINTTLQRHAQQTQGRPDPDAIIEDLTRQGRGNAAMAFSTKVQESRKTQADTLAKSLDNGTKALTFASNALRGVTDDASYQAVKPQIAAVLGADTVNQYLPPAYDPAAIAAVIERGTDTQERLQKMREAADKIKDGPKTAQDWTLVVSTALSAQPDPESYAQTMTTLADLGAPKGILAIFPPPGTPNAPKLAAALGITPEKQAGLLGDAATRAETRRHNTVTEAAEATREKRLTAQGGEAPSAAGKATAERWLQGRVTAIDTAFKKQGSYDENGVLQPAMTEDEKRQKTLDAVNSARRQVGKSPLTKAPTDLNQWATDAAPSEKAPPVGAPPPVSSHNRPQVVAPTAPARAETPKASTPAEPAPVAAPAAPAPTEPKRAPMTRAKAVEVLQGIAKRPPTKAEIDRFMQRNPYVQ